MRTMLRLIVDSFREVLRRRERRFSRGKEKDRRVKEGSSR